MWSIISLVFLVLRFKLFKTNAIQGFLQRFSHKERESSPSDSYVTPSIEDTSFPALASHRVGLVTQDAHCFVNLWLCHWDHALQLICTFVQCCFYPSIMLIWDIHIIFYQLLLLFGLHLYHFELLSLHLACLNSLNALECCSDLVKDMPFMVLNASEHHRFSLSLLPLALFPDSKCFFAAIAVESVIVASQLLPCFV